MLFSRCSRSSRRACLNGARLVGSVFLLSVAACTPSATYQPPAWSLTVERDAGFDAAVMLDATHIVFAWSDGRFRYVAADVWRRGQREYVSDEKVIGVYDVATGTGRVVLSDRTDRLGDGNGAFGIAAARGGFALVFRDRTTENGVMVDPGGWFVLDLESGALEPADLAAEADTGAMRTLTHAEIAAHLPSPGEHPAAATVLIGAGGQSLRLLTGSGPDVQEREVVFDVDALR